MKEFVVVYEHGDMNWGAMVPDLPGCISIGTTREDVEKNVREAIELYLDVLKERGEPVPKPRHSAGRVTVAA